MNGLTGRTDLNEHAACVCKAEPRADGRIGIRMLTSQERVWIRPGNLTVIHSGHTFRTSLPDDEATQVTRLILDAAFKRQKEGRPRGPVLNLNTEKIEKTEKMSQDVSICQKQPDIRALENMPKLSLKFDCTFECTRCGAHRPMGYRCCGRYVGGHPDERPVERRNIHDHPDADEDEIADFLQATLARLP